MLSDVGKTTSGNGQAWSSPSHRGQWGTGKIEETSCEIICGAPTTPAVKDDDDDDDCLLPLLSVQSKMVSARPDERKTCL